MSFSIHITVTIIKIHKYLDTLLTDGVYCNSHTEYVSFQNGLFQSWHVSGLSVTKISTWYLILQKCIFTNTQSSFDRKATGLVAIPIHCPNNTVLPPASLLRSGVMERQQRPVLLSWGCCIERQCLAKVHAVWV